ncbi:hypothetical protein KM043_004563 [Ampulex compressa]|nr:hypothetical protein KM043_004563 [Ampulex compressa]
MTFMIAYLEVIGAEQRQRALIDELSEMGRAGEARGVAENGLKYDVFTSALMNRLTSLRESRPMKIYHTVFIIVEPPDAPPRAARFSTAPSIYVRQERIEDSGKD